MVYPNGYTYCSNFDLTFAASLKVSTPSKTRAFQCLLQSFFFKSPKLPAMVLCLGEPPRRFLLYLYFIFISFLIFILLPICWCVDVLHFIFDLHFVVICRFLSITFCFSTSSLTLPSTMAKVFDTSFYTFSPAHCKVIRDTFIFNHSDIFLQRAIRFWVGVFYPQTFFTL